jgi:hypothetical protein
LLSVTQNGAPHIRYWRRHCVDRTAKSGVRCRGIVVSASVEIGDEVTILQNVAVGRKVSSPAAR